uniref:Cytochrome P450 6a2 n=1 Tax=Cacopsylla melanoneura TaxID=428564 RepID=A0A8D8RLY9_9HEMI
MGILTDSTTVDTLFFLVVLVYLLYSLYTKDFLKWEKLGIFYLKPSFPFGSMYELYVKRKPKFLILQDFYWKFKAQNVPYGGYFQLNEPELMIVDPGLLKHILITDFSSFQDRGLSSVNVDKEPIIRHLFSIDGARWKPMRQKVTPTFSSGKIKFMFETMKACSHDLRAHLDSNLSESCDIIDVKTMCESYTLDVIGSCAFGLDVHCLRNPQDEFRTAALGMFNRSYTTLLNSIVLKTCPTIAQSLGFKQIGRDTTRFFTQLVTQNVEYREKNNVHRQDFLNLLMELKNKRGEHGTGTEDLAITMDLIVSNVFIFFIAGFHTSAFAMSLCLVELANNKQIQDKLREEIIGVLKESGGQVTYENIKAMPYLDKVAKETLRKYPSVTQLNRRSTRPYTLPGSKVTIETRTRIIVPVYAIHHDPAHYPNPDVFDPERFEPSQVAARPPFTYLPFGDGPRNCIGLRFGTLQFKLGIISALCHHEFLPLDTPEERNYHPDTLMMIAANVRLRARKLN